MNNRMLRLETLQLYNWGYAPFLEPLPIGDLTLLYGNNGSGKTTYLTALGLLLGVRSLPRGETFERYIRDDADWAFFRAIVDNRMDSLGKRPFDAIIPNPDQCDQFTLACMVVYQSGNWNRHYFIVPGADFQPSPTDKIDSTYRFTLTRYQQALEQVGVRQALLKLLELGVIGVRDMREPKALFDFFMKLIGNEDIRQRYNSARREWREQRDRADRLRDRYDMQEKEIQETGEQIHIQRQRREIEARLNRNKLFVDHARLRDMQHLLLERRQQRAELQRQREDFNWDLGELIQYRESLASEQEVFNEQYQVWKTKRDQLENDFHEADKQVDRLETRLAQLTGDIENLYALPDISVEAAQAALNAAQEAESSARLESQHLSTRHDDLQAEHGELLSGQVRLPRYVTEFTTALRQEGLPYTLLADTVSVDDPRWLRAVEGALGGERFTVIINNEADLLRAKHIAQTLRYRHWVSPPRMQSAQALVTDSLLELVTVSEPAATGWVADRLAGVRCVETVDEGHRITAQTGTITITPQAYWQERRGGRSVWVNDLVCGAAAREARLREVEAELEQVNIAQVAARALLMERQTELEAMRQQLDAAYKRLELPEKERERALLEAESLQAHSRRDQLAADYNVTRSQEDDINAEQQRLAVALTNNELNQARLQDEIRKLNDQIQALNIDLLMREARELESDLKPLSAELQATFEAESRASSTYEGLIREDERKLEGLPELDYELNEDLYEQQKADLDRLKLEVDAMYERAREMREVLDRAKADYDHHIDQIFTQGMRREFVLLCRMVDAHSDVQVIKSADLDDWSLEIRIGFDGKSMLPLSSAPLSRGQEVLTGLYLVLAALRAVNATPVLILDELMSLLDERNAPRVLLGLRETGAQCFVATPQSLPGAHEYADVLWGFTKKAEDAVYAPPIAVAVRRNGISPAARQ